MNRFALAVLISCAAMAATAQQSTEIVVDDVPLETYLQALADIAPAARQGAEAYMSAFQSRCGRPMKTLELRRAVAEGSGNATLLAMMRAAGQRDLLAQQRLAGAVACPRG